MVPLVFLYVCFIVPVWSELRPPENVQVDEGFLTWRSDSGLDDSKFTVLQKSLRSDSWEIVPHCSLENVTSCNVTSMMATGGPECVQLAVREETEGESSEAATACSTHEGACTPAVQLMGAPGSITVQLRRDEHPLIDHYGGVIRHKVFFGEKGSPLEPLKNAYSASVERSKLEEGRSYCASVQFTFYNQPVGLPSCAVCERVPAPRRNTAVIVSGVVLVLIFLSSLSLYFFLFHRKRVKMCLRLPYHIPSDTLEPPNVCVRPNSSVEEDYDKISFVDAI